MTKKQWIKHMETITGVKRPELGGRRDEWINAGHEHYKNSPDCPECKARRATRRKNREAQITAGLYKDLGMKKAKGGLGGTYWEDVEKYGTGKEIEFLAEMMGNPIMQFVALKKQFVDGPGAQRDKLTPEETEALNTIEQFKTFADLKKWYDANPELISKFTEIFKRKLGQIYKGAFDYAKTKK